MSFSHRPPLKVIVRIGEVSVELDWPDEGMPAAPAPAAEACCPHEAAVPETGPDPAVHRIRAAIVGVFYRSPEPGAEPFVRPGDLVTPGQQLAIIEAMKMMTPVEADHGGWVSEILVGDGQSVEFGTELIAITTDGPR
jgi:acetyl-CoA carboxylase biotin carboxyl carrier protein